MAGRESQNAAAFEALRIKAMEARLPMILNLGKEAARNAETTEYYITQGMNKLNKGVVRLQRPKKTISTRIPSVGGMQYMCSYINDRVGHWEPDLLGIKSYTDVPLKRAAKTKPAEFLKKIEVVIRKHYTLAPFFEKVLATHPLVGLAILIEYGEIKSSGNSKNEGNRDRSWFTRTVEHVAASMTAGEDIFSELQRNASNPTKNLMADAQKEVELMLMGILNISFASLKNQEQDILEKKDRKSLMLTHFQFPIASRDRVPAQKMLTNLRQTYAEYVTEDREILDLILPNIEELSSNETTEFELPFYVLSGDLEKVAAFFKSYLEGVRFALEQKNPPTKEEHAGSTLYTYANGCTIRVRPQKFDTASTGSQETREARIAIRYKNFSLRIDRDEIRNQVMMDFGGADISHAVACAELYIEDSIRNKPQSILSASLAVEKTGGTKQVLSEEHRLSLLVAAMLYNLRSLGLIKKKHLSHHSNEFVGKDVHYNKFAQIAEEIKTILAKGH